MFFAGLGFIVTYPVFNKAPTCFDYKQNGDEKGVDCGGSCEVACLSEVTPLSVVWARSFKVVAGRYNAVAYLVNHNKNKVVDKISYKFRFADQDNIYIGKREGTAFVPAGSTFAIFEPGIEMGNSVPVYTTFEFTQAPLWHVVSDKKLNQLKILISNIVLENENTSPKLSATLKNESIFTIPNLGAVAILYDGAGNAISASRTYVSDFSPLQQVQVNFTWPEPFSTAVVAKEILPSYDVDSVKLQ